MGAEAFDNRGEDAGVTISCEISLTSYTVKALTGAEQFRVKKSKEGPDLRVQI